MSCSEKKRILEQLRLLLRMKKKNSYFELWDLV